MKLYRKFINIEDQELEKRSVNVVCAPSYEDFMEFLEENEIDHAGEAFLLIEEVENLTTIPMNYVKNFVWIGNPEVEVDRRKEFAYKWHTLIHKHHDRIKDQPMHCL